MKIYCNFNDMSGFNIEFKNLNHIQALAGMFHKFIDHNYPNNTENLTYKHLIELMIFDFSGLENDEKHADLPCLGKLMSVGLSIQPIGKMIVAATYLMHKNTDNLSEERDVYLNIFTEGDEISEIYFIEVEKYLVA